LTVLTLIDPKRGGTPQDKPNFTSLCVLSEPSFIIISRNVLIYNSLRVSEMRTAINAEAASSGKSPLMITVAAPAGPDDFASFDAAVGSNSHNFRTSALTLSNPSGSVPAY
jgi:hypothetical protein